MERPCFHKKRSCKHCFKNERTLVTIFKSLTYKWHNFFHPLFQFWHLCQFLGENFVIWRRSIGSCLIIHFLQGGQHCALPRWVGFGYVQGCMGWPFRCLKERKQELEPLQNTVQASERPTYATLYVAKTYPPWQCTVM